jgi:uncharacterized membrane protein YkvA (DUF1232 family)
MVIQKKRLVKTSRVSFTHELFVLYYAVKDNRTPLRAKLVALAAIVYLISPIDLIPDIIPVAGYLDDLVIVPVLLHVAFSALPAEVKNAGWEKAKKHMLFLRALLVTFICMLIATMAAIFLLFKHLLHF